MAWLENVETSKRAYLAERTLVGRGHQSWARVAHRSVSQEHAVLAFGSRGWSVKDLGSRNGTWVDSRRLQPGVSASVGKGARLQFGDVCFRLTSVEPPTLCAQRMATAECSVAEGGVLTLPDGDSPVASAYESTSGSWVIDIEGRVQPLRDGDTSYIEAERYVLRVPEAHIRRVFESTVEASAQLVLSELTLRLEVSRDQESILTRLVGDARSLDVPSRATHEVLLVLARQRVKDQEMGLVESECGWVYSDKLSGLMGSDPQKVNLDVHRLRQQLAKLGVLDASSIIERRVTSHQMRVGVTRIEMHE